MAFYSNILLPVLLNNKTTQGALLLALAGLVILLVLTRPNKAPELQEAVPANVVITAVRTHDMVPHQTVSGRLEPMRRAALHFELNGQIRERPVEPGQVVDQDAVLLALVAGDYRDALARAEAQLELERSDIQRDRELLDLARRNQVLQQAEVDRLEKLGKNSLISQSRLDETRIKLLQLESEVARLKAGTATAESRLGLLEAERNQAARDLERTRLRAPFPGTVNAVEVQVGDYVTPNQSVLELIDTSELDLYVEVRGELAQALEQGQQVSVSAGGVQLQGHIIALQTAPDPATFTHALRVRLPGQDLRPGMVARVRLPLQPLENLIAVPVTAILLDEGSAYVFRVDAKDLERVQIVPGRRVENLQVVSSGLNAGDRIVVRDVAALSDGQQVNILE